MENEIGRKVICFDSLIAAMTESQKQICYRLRDNGLFICLVETEGKGWSVVGNINPMWVTISDICERAVAAEKGALLVDGKRIKAEDYITLWRAQSTARTSIDDAVRSGFTPRVTIRRPTEKVKALLPDALESPDVQFIPIPGPVTNWNIPVTSSASCLTWQSLLSIQPNDDDNELHYTCSVGVAVHAVHVTKSKKAAVAQDCLFGEMA